MIRRISREEARKLSRRCRDYDREACRRDEKDDKEDDVVFCELDLQDQVDKAVEVLSEFGVEEIDYEEAGFDEDDMPEENEAICQDKPDDPDEEPSDVGVVVDVDNNKLVIDLDEEDNIEIDLDQTVAEVEKELRDDLEEKLKKQESLDACNRRFEDWKRRRNLRREGKRISIHTR